jgi:SAM-dependent methyltransferase
MKINYHRWIEAQKFEFHDWNTLPKLTNLEWQEIYYKYSPLFSKLQTRLKLTPQKKIIDVGCGPTCISRLLPTGRRFGVDPLAKKLKLTRAYSDIKIYQGRGEDLPFPANYFDLAICRNVIDHTYQPQKVITEISRVLKPSSHFIFAGYVYNPFIAFTKNLGEKFNLLRNIGHPHTYTLKSFKDLIRPDFEIKKVWLIHEGRHPNDFGKINEKPGSLSLPYRLILSANRLLGQKWFVREYCLLCHKRQ